MKVIAHKGGGSSAPENTRASLKHALSIGADAVEVDIWPTADEQFVLFHDVDIKRLTGHVGWTMYLTSSELQALELRDNTSSSFAGEHVLLLEEALDLLDGKVQLLLEVKRTRHDLVHYNWIEEKLACILRAHKAFSWTSIISFDHRSLLELRATEPDAILGMLYAGEWLSLWQEVDALKPKSLIPHWAQTTPQLVKEAHRRGLMIYPWVVNDEGWMTRFASMGVDGLITDRPEIAIELTSKMQD